MMQHVYINRRGMQSIEIEQPVIRIPLKPGDQTTLDIDVVNYENPTHIYLSSQGDLKDKIAFNRNNPYIDGEELLTLTATNPPDQNAFYEGEITISTGYGSKEESFLLQIGQMENEPPPDAIDVDESLTSMNYRSKARGPSAYRSTFSIGTNIRRPHFYVNVDKIRGMSNLPYILLALGVIIALILLAAGSVSFGVLILGLIIIVVLAYYTWRLLD